MHEFALMADLLKKIETIAKEHEAEKVTQVDVWLGALAHISPDHFREHFEQGVVGSVAEKAQLSVEQSEEIEHPNAQDILLRHIEVE